MKFYLKEDIVNSKTRAPYGVKGEAVTTISLHDRCHIVQGEKGERFGVNESLLSEEFIQKDTVNGSETKTKIHKARKNK